MKKNLFHEYLNSKNKITSPVVDPSGDQIDPKTPPNKPPKEGYAKGGQEYSTGTKKTKKGALGGLGDIKNVGWTNSVYKPNVENPHGESPAKLPTAEQIQLARTMIEDIFAQPGLLEQFVKQAKRHGILGPLVAEIFEQKESASHLARIMFDEEYGPKIYRNITAALNEESAAPFSGQLEDEADEDDEEEADEEMPPEDAQNLDVSMQSDNMGQDPSQMGGQPPMDPNIMGQMGQMPQPPMDPSQMGGQMPPMMDPNMMGQMPPMQAGPQQPMMPPMPPMPMMPGSPQMMKAFQRAMMRAYQRSMMRKR